MTISPESIYGYSRHTQPIFLRALAEAAREKTARACLIKAEAGKAEELAIEAATQSAKSQIEAGLMGNPDAAQARKLIYQAASLRFSIAEAEEEEKEAHIAALKSALLVEDIPLKEAFDEWATIQADVAAERKEVVGTSDGYGTYEEYHEAFQAFRMSDSLSKRSAECQERISRAMSIVEQKAEKAWADGHRAPWPEDVAI